LLAELELDDEDVEPEPVLAAFAGAAAGFESDELDEELDEFDDGIEEEPPLPSLRESVR